MNLFIDIRGSLPLTYAFRAARGRTFRMRAAIVLLLSLMLAAGPGLADEPKPAAKKSEKKAAAKSDKNVFQKTESSVADWAHRNKTWRRAGRRGTRQTTPPMPTGKSGAPR